jgi:hypothetical protein
MLGKLPWIVLPLLATIPLLVRITVSKKSSVRQQALMALLLATIPAAVSIFIAWHGFSFNALS